MDKITQTMLFRQAVINYANKYGIAKSAIRCKTNRQYIYIYRCLRRYDGTLQSLADRFHRSYSHPNQHTEAGLKLIKDMRRRNSNAGLAVLWVKLMQKGLAADEKRTTILFEVRPKQYGMQHKTICPLNWHSQKSYIDTCLKTGEVF